MADAEGPPPAAELDAALAAVEGARGPVYVHCVGGKDRTGGLIGLLQMRRGASLDEVGRTWQRHGPPAPGWRALLRARAAAP